ncbi:polysaccharide biosynthesis/export family protein [Mongoliitalea lutea]|uniref:Polysaccharide export protein N-terminal domain-containing protein n=1 Tax=Mongoliitalea lutea TaxID=849756 RepID=A0A8J3CWE4_9BACT|nr:polysaccharide biosynthesis/export family protein [Mongoliitalea lutea]GHB31468.1 hypothetical protein GCM10008106_10310 [Mongoliitalea lutea]
MELESSLIESSELFPYSLTEYRLQANDIVDIQLKTTSIELNLLLDAVIGDVNAAGMMGGPNGADIFFINGYSLDDDGYVELPLLGPINLLGKTLRESKEIVEKELRYYVQENEYFVRVRLGGIRFSALGEFNMPGKQVILQNRATIFEAIAVAGDLSILAKRDEIILLRQYPDGSRLHKLNLNDKTILNSEFYFIKPNDVLYAEPLKVREIGAGANLLQTLTFVTSIITTTALIFTLISR